jgi:glutathione S-transferase
MYTLYYAPGSASMVVHLALLEIGAAYELKLVDFAKREQADPAYLALNPHGTVPTLIIDGTPRTESAALLIMLAQRHRNAGLIPPAGTPAEDEWLQWVVYLSNSLASTFRLWFYPGDLVAPDHVGLLKEGLRRKIEHVWSMLDGQVAASGGYLVGGSFSGADLLVTMLMRWSRNMPRPATEWPALSSLADRVRARPSWRRLYELEGLKEW